MSVFPRACNSFTHDPCCHTGQGRNPALTPDVQAPSPVWRFASWGTAMPLVAFAPRFTLASARLCATANVVQIYADHGVTAQAVQYRMNAVEFTRTILM